MTSTSTSTSPLARSGLVTSLAQEIAAQIRREQLRPGDRLPTVKELAERFDVAVPTVREALQRLEAIGVVQVRHGAGIFVRAEQPRLMFAQPGQAVVDGQVILDLIQARLLIEPYLAEHAALAAQGDQVARLADLLREAERCLAGHDHELQQANMAFHLGIARCSGNVVLTQVMDLLVNLYASEQTAMLSIADDRRHDHEDHVAILAAIQTGDAEQARSLMQRHLEGVRDLMAARLAAAAHARKVVWLNAAGGRNQRCRAAGLPGGADTGKEGDRVAGQRGQRDRAETHRSATGAISAGRGVARRRGGWPVGGGVHDSHEGREVRR